MNGGQALEQAPQRMQVSASRNAGSARIASRPLSSTTQCSSRGPWAPVTYTPAMSADPEGPLIQFT